MLILLHYELTCFMNFFRELIEILSDRKLKSAGLVTGKGSKNIYQKLYGAFKSHPDLKEEEIFDKMLQTEKKNVNYRITKLRFKERLLNHFLFIDLEKEGLDPCLMALVRGTRNLHIANLLMLFSAKKTAKRILEITLKKTLEFQLIEIAIPVLKQLRYHASLEGNELKFMHYHNLLKKQLKLQKAALLADYINLDTEILVSRKTNIDLPVKVKVHVNAGRIKKIAEKYNLFEIWENYYRLKNYACQLDYDYKQSKGIVHDYEELLMNNKIFFRQRRFAEIGINQLLNAMYLKDHESAGRYIHFNTKHLEKGSSNWFTFKHLQFMFFMRTERYSEAVDVFLETKEQNKLSEQISQVQEKWMIYHAFSTFVNAAFLNQPKILPDFNLKEFSKSIPVIKEDKKGYNVPSLIINLLYLFLNKDFHSLIDIKDSIRVYSLRYFEDANTPRSLLFFKIIHIAEKNEFMRVPTIAESNNLLLQLKEQDKPTLWENAEIIPYDVLAEWIFERLE
jgi:hypothetical protein